MAKVFEKFYETYAMYLGDPGKHSDKINPKDPSISMSNCVELVDNVLMEARRKGQKPLADTRGVRNRIFLIFPYFPLVSISQLLILKNI